MLNPLSLLKRHRKIGRQCKRIQESTSGTAPIVLVYQMGKVASSSIYHALRSRDDCFAFHTHLLSALNRNKRRNHIKDSFWAPDERLRLSDTLAKNIIEPKHPAKVITLVRDPFARNISAFFENHPAPRANYKKQSQFVAELIEVFMRETNHMLPGNWYLNEFNGALGINIFDYPFDSSLKWSRHRLAPYDLLVLRTDLDDVKKDGILSDFLEIKDLKISRTNQTSTKSVNPVYQEFKETIRFPKEIADPLLNSRFTRHFFSAREIETMREKWTSS